MSSLRTFIFPLSIEVLFFNSSSYSPKGWPLTYIPNTSFSIASLSLSSNSFIFGIELISCWTSTVSFPIWKPSNKEIWPFTFFFLSIDTLSNNFSYPIIKLALLSLILSKAPHLIKLSSTLLFKSFESSLFTKSAKSLKSPFNSLSLIILFITLTPTFLTAAKPNLMLWPSTENLPKLLLISGFKISISKALHSLIYSTTLSVLPITLVIKAAINSTG